MKMWVLTKRDCSFSVEEREALRGTEHSIWVESSYSRDKDGRRYRRFTDSEGWYETEEEAHRAGLSLRRRRFDSAKSDVISAQAAEKRQMKALLAWEKQMRGKGYEVEEG